MGNMYKYNLTFKDKHEEEDRETINEFYREQTYYYNTLGDIYDIYLEALEQMSIKEIQNIIKCKGPIVPFMRLK